MIWNSVVWMTATDLAVIVAVTALAFSLWRSRVFVPAGQATLAPLLIIAGLGITALFHFADLVVMLGFPYLIDARGATALMMRLHLDVRWFVTVASLALIGAGLWRYAIRHRQSISAVEASEARYRSIVRDQSDFIVRWQPGGIRTWVNDPYRQVFGVSGEDLIGTSFLGSIAASDRARVAAELAALTPDAPSRTGIHEVLLSDGKQHWQEWTDTALFSETGDLIEFQSVGRDVTARVETEIALAESESRFRGLVESTSDCVWQMDREGHNVYSNSKVEDLLGYTPDELRGMHWKELMRAEDAREVDERMSHNVQQGCGWQQWVYRVRHRNGSYRYLESTADPIFDDRDELIGFRGIDRDVTFRTLMSQASTSLVGSSEVDLDRRITQVFASIGSCYGVERIGLWWMAGKYLRLRHEWADQVSTIPTIDFDPDQSVPWCSAKLRNNETVMLSSLDELPEPCVDRVFLDRMGTKSLLLLPLIHDDELVGVASFSIVSTHRVWSDEVECDLRHLSEKVAAAYAQSEATRIILRRETDLAQCEGLAHVGSFSCYAYTKDAVFPHEWRVEFSPEQCALLEIRPEDASFEMFLSRVHEEDRQMILDALDRILHEETEVEVQYRVLTPSGKLKYFFNRTVMHRGQDGRNFGMIGANKDVTEQVLREESLKRALVEIEELKDQVEEKYTLLRQEVRSVRGFERIVGDSAGLRNCLDLVAKAAPTDVTVLVLGETGTGKELIAKSIHDLSLRREGPMVSLNCTALPADLVESELFGHERGAFTGAHKRRIGRFEAANGGTLFLDEIGDLPLSLQGKLLRVLQEGEFQRVGGSETVLTDVRLIVATNRDLEAAVADGKFRADLYYRINTIPVLLPPLRERREDIPLLAQHFVEKHGSRLGKSIEAISTGMLRYMQGQEWPGNVRELEHFVERALISQRGPVLNLSDGGALTNGVNAAARNNAEGAYDLRSIEKEHIRKTLDETRWVIGGVDGAASKLGVPPSTLRSKMKKLGIRRMESIERAAEH